jgi:hypothetical protein
VKVSMLRAIWRICCGLWARGFFGLSFSFDIAQ